MDNTMIDKLSEELDFINPEDISAYGLTLSVGNTWFVRLWWEDKHSVAELHPIRMLVDSRPDLLIPFTRPQGVASVVKHARKLHEWSMHRGYSVGISGANWWSKLQLRVFDWLGGFAR